MAEFNVYIGLVGEDLKSVGIFEFPTQEEADDFAYTSACKSYDENPTGRTVEEIIAEEDVDRSEATLAYEEEREDEIDYYAEELDNDEISEEDDDDSSFWYSDEEADN